jgi:hypothetical protein
VHPWRLRPSVEVAPIRGGSAHPWRKLASVEVADLGTSPDDGCKFYKRSPVGPFNFFIREHQLLLSSGQEPSMMPHFSALSILFDSFLMKIFFKTFSQSAVSLTNCNIDTEAKCRHLKKFTCKGTLR